MTGFAVIDTNVVASGVLGAPGSTATWRIVDAMTDGYLRFLLSDDVLREYRRVLLKPSIAQRHGLTEAEMDDLLLEIILNATMREPAMSRVSEDSAGGGEGSVPAGDAHVAALLKNMPGCPRVTGDRRLAEAVGPWCKTTTPAVFAATLRE